MTWRKALVGLSLLAVTVAVLLLLGNDRSAHRGDGAALLAHFGLSSKDYALRQSFLEQPLLWDANLSVAQVHEQWMQTVHKIGDSMPTWFVGREGIFVVVQRPDGSLVGTPWVLIGGRTRLVVCRDDDGEYCGITLKRVGGTWIMGAPVTRGPLPTGTASP